MVPDPTDRTDGRAENIAPRRTEGEPATRDAFAPLEDVAPAVAEGTVRNWPVRTEADGFDRMELRHDVCTDDFLDHVLGGDDGPGTASPDWSPPPVVDGFSDRTQFDHAVSLLAAYHGFFATPTGVPEEHHPIDAVRALRAIARALRGVSTHPLVADDAPTTTVVNAAATQATEAADTTARLAAARGFNPNAGLDADDRA